MIILGIDPSYTRTGLAVLHCGDIPGTERVVATGTIKTPTRLSDQERCREIAAQCETWARSYGVDAVGVENQFVGEGNKQAGLRLVYLRSAIEQRIAGQIPGLKVVDVNPAQRQAALGVSNRLGRADVKRRVVEVVQRRYGLEVRHDEADAIGIALVAWRIVRRGPKAEQLRMTLKASRKARL
jgi:Holliday junction resolvasome RuvABC endonuclease subunit